MHKLTLSMIVKNEADNIERCISSVAPYIDYYVICDTGSTDNTKEIIKKFFDEKGIPGEIHDHKWEDFGTNRSKALELCHGKTKWIIMIDADDSISGNLPVDKLDDNLDGYHVKIGRGNCVWWRSQIFNVQKKKWWYVEPLHEYAMCDLPMNLGKLEGDYIWHARTEGCRAKSASSETEKYQKDYYTLKAYLDQDPNQPRKQFYAAQSAYDARMYAVAEEEYLKRIKLENWIEEVFISWMKVGECRERLNRPLHEIIDAYLMAYETLPNRVEPLYRMSCVFRKHERPKCAFLISSFGPNLKISDDSLFLDKDSYTWGILDEIGSTAYYANQPVIGIQACEKLLSEPYLPEAEKERVINNYNSYIRKFDEVKHKKPIEKE